MLCFFMIIVLVKLPSDNIWSFFCVIYTDQGKDKIEGSCTKTRFSMTTLCCGLPKITTDLSESYLCSVKLRIDSLLMWSACHKKSYLTNLEVRNLKSEISCLCPVWLSQFCLFWKKMGKGFVNIPKFVNSTHNKYLFLWHADHIILNFF